jgi:HEAT repeat protein
MQAPKNRNLIFLVVFFSCFPVFLVTSSEQIVTPYNPIANPTLEESEIALLIKAIREKRADPKTRERVHEAIQRMKPRGERAAKLLLQLIDESTIESEASRAAGEALKRFQPDDIPALQTLLRRGLIQNNFDLRDDQTIRVLQNHGLINELTDLRSSKTLEALQNNPAVIKTLSEKGLLRRNPRLREYVVAALTKIGANDPEYSAQLKKIVSNKQNMALSTRLGNLAHAPSGFYNHERQIIIDSIALLARIKNEEAVPAIVEHLHNPSWEVRVSATEALAAFNPNERIILALLESLQQEQNSFVIRKLYRTLEAIKSLLPKDSPQSRLLAAVVQTEKSPAKREALIKGARQAFKSKVEVLDSIERTKQPISNNKPRRDADEILASRKKALDKPEGYYESCVNSALLMEILDPLF